MTASAGKKILIIVENLPCPFDRRVWQEATTLRDNGYEVSIICPKGKGYTESFEVIEDIHIYRHPMPLEADGALGYLVEYSTALFFQFFLAFRVLFTRGFDAIHACNPPDLIFLVGGFFKLFGKKFLFDHHDINPELYEAKFGRRDLFYRLLLACEKLTFRCADIVISTNESYRKIAIERGGVKPENIYVVRSGPRLDRLRRVKANPIHRKGRRYLIGYVGVIGRQEGVDHLLNAVQHTVNVAGRKDIQFGVVGDGTELEYLRNLAVELGIEDYVSFYGRVSDEILLEVLNTADVCINPDIANAMNDKSTMNKVMEYMALAKPIVQYDLTEGRFSAQEASLYAERNNPQDLAEKVLTLVDDPARRREMGETGYRRVKEKLEWQHEVPKLVAAYASLFRNKLAASEDHSPSETG